MPIFFLVVFAVMAFPSEDMIKFNQHSNGVAEYVFVSADPCPTGLRKSGFSYAPFGSLVLKQKNADGTVDKPVCAD